MVCWTRERFLRLCRPLVLAGLFAQTGWHSVGYHDCKRRSPRMHKSLGTNGRRFPDRVAKYCRALPVGNAHSLILSFPKPSLLSRLAVVLPLPSVSMSLVSTRPARWALPFRLFS